MTGEGQVAVFVAVDRRGGTHVAPRATRFEAPDPAKRAPLLRRLCPEIGRGSRSGMQFAWLRAGPPGNGCAEPFIAPEGELFVGADLDTVGTSSGAAGLSGGLQHNMARRDGSRPP